MQQNLQNGTNKNKCN